MERYFNLFELDRLKIEEEVLNDIKSKLNRLLFYKIRIRSKAYKDLELFISEIENKKDKITESIKQITNYQKTELSELYVETVLLEKLLLLRKEFNFEDINSTIEYFLKYYEEDVYTFKLTKIKKYIISDTIDKNLKRSKFYIGIAKDNEKKIVYTIEDLIIKSGVSYLDLDKFKVYQYDSSEYFLFSPKFTLVDLDDFFQLIKK